MRIRTYNMQDEQFAFHRSLRSEEVRFQFRGDALDLSEFRTSKFLPARSPSSRSASPTATAVRLGTSGTIFSYYSDQHPAGR
jgi:hypothetical protein